MTLTRDDWKLLGRILISTQGPAYAERLRMRAVETSDPQARATLLARARAVEKGAATPEETMDDLETLYDLVFEKPGRKSSKARRRTH